MREIRENHVDDDDCVNKKKIGRVVGSRRMLMSYEWHANEQALAINSLVYGGCLLATELDL